jgi:hypothetical protein
MFELYSKVVLSVALPQHQLHKESKDDDPDCQ